MERNAAHVPHTAITPAVAMSRPSYQVHLPARMHLAVSGPITDNKNAEKEPRNAIIALNSGTQMETVTDRSVTNIRWVTPKKRLSHSFRSIWSDPNVLWVFRASGDMGWGSSPRRTSSVALS